MVNKEFGITGIGNSIVDIIVQVEDDFLLENDLRKGMMSVSYTHLTLPTTPYV